MKVLLLNGSTRKNGCTYLALSEVAKALNTEGVETEIVQMGGVPVRDCIGCNGCAGKGQCVFGDDMVNEMIAKARRRSHSYTVPIDRISLQVSRKADTSLRGVGLGRLFYLISCSRLRNKGSSKKSAIVMFKPSQIFLLPIRAAILQQVLDFAVQNIADLCDKIQINSLNMILIIPVDDLIFDSSEGF